MITCPFCGSDEFTVPVTGVLPAFTTVLICECGATCEQFDEHPDREIRAKVKWSKWFDEEERV